MDVYIYVYIGWICFALLTVGLGSLILLGASASGGFVLLSGIINAGANMEVSAFNAIIISLGLLLCVIGRTTDWPKTN